MPPCQVCAGTAYGKDDADLAAVERQLIESGGGGGTIFRNGLEGP